jgi:ABC-type multidrug transport system fused ATPase/permease subunit
VTVAIALDTDDGKDRFGVRQLPGLIRLALMMAWTAGRTDLLLSAGLQILGGFGIVGMLLVGRAALDALLRAVAEGGSLTSILPWVGIICAVAVGQFFASAMQRERQQILGELVMRYVEGRVLEVTAAADLVMFDTPEFHNRVQRIQTSGHQPLNMVAGLSGLVGALTGVVAGLAALITVAPALVPLLALVLLPAWIGASRRGKAFFLFFKHMTPRDRQRHYLAHVLRDSEVAKEVRAFGFAGYVRERYDGLYAERIAELRRVTRRQTYVSLGANLVVGLVLAATLLTVAWLALRGTVPLASAGIAVASIALVGGRLASAGWSAGALTEAGRYLDDYLAFMALLPQVRQARPTGPAPREFSRLTVSDVTFTYPTGTEPALHGVSMEVAAGEVVALVGENGSGKTTLAKLLAGLYQPDHGAIRWDGMDMSTVDPDEWRSQVAVIFQDFARFHLTVAENIGLGRVATIGDDRAIHAAAEQAGADRFVEALPEKYATMLGPEFMGGTDLSVGQWQRIALARAFFRAAPFVVLDEPTAALDPRAEQDLFDRIRSLLSGRTVLLISHRFSSVRSADRIYVLDGGTVVEHGSHEELMALGGLYAELFTLQAAAYLDHD